MMRAHSVLSEGADRQRARQLADLAAVIRAWSTSAGTAAATRTPSRADSGAMSASMLVWPRAIATPTTSDRPDRKAMSREQARDEIAGGAGTSSAPRRRRCFASSTRSAARALQPAWTEAPRPSRRSRPRSSAEPSPAAPSPSRCPPLELASPERPPSPRSRRATQRTSQLGTRASALFPVLPHSLAQPTAAASRGRGMNSPGRRNEALAGAAGSTIARTADRRTSRHHDPKDTCKPGIRC